MKRALFILGVLEDEDVDWLILVGRRQGLSPGTVLIREGQTCDDIFLVLDGLLDVLLAPLENPPIAQLSSGENDTDEPLCPGPAQTSPWTGVNSILRQRVN